ncbi:MAG: MFS transporter [Chloroflexia bacterium]|nr:MFS transporter [Chloroflexia bacterium]
MSSQGLFRRPAPCRPRLGGLWRSPDFLRLWGAETVSQLGSQLTLVVIPLIAALTLNASPLEMGLLTAAGGIPRLLIGLIAGVRVDRLPRRPILILTDVGRALALLAIPIAALFGALGMELLFVVAFLVGVQTVFFNAAWVAFVPHLVGRAGLADANGKLMASMSVAQVVGPALAGSLIALLTAPWVILLDALSFAWSGLLIKRIRTREPAPDRSGRGRRLGQEMREGLGVLVHSPVLRADAGSMATTVFSGYMFLSVYVLYMTENLGLSAGGGGLVFACGGVGALVGAVIAAPLAARFGVGRTIVWSCGLFGVFGLTVPLAIFAPRYALPLVVFAEFAQWLALLVFDVNRVSLRQAMTPDRLQGRVSASSQVLVGGMQPLGALTGGALGSLVGVPVTLVLACVGMFSAVLWLLRSPVRTIEHLPTEPPTSANVS